MKRCNDIEDEIDAIRLKLREELKGVAPEEETAYVKSQVAPVLKEFGIRAAREIKADKLISA
jgi:hypothetical protein